MFVSSIWSCVSTEWRGWWELGFSLYKRWVRHKSTHVLSLRWLRFVGRGSTNAQVLTSVVKDPLHRHRHLRSSPGFKPRWVGHSPQESEQHRTRTRGHLNLQPLLCFVKWPPLTACSFCSNRYGPVGGSHFHWCGVYLLLYNGRWLRQFKSF